MTDCWHINQGEVKVRQSCSAESRNESAKNQRKNMWPSTAFARYSFNSEHFVVSELSSYVRKTCIVTHSKDSVSSVGVPRMSTSS